jgi:transcriptional regulator with XRE-family HTH domain
MLRTFAYAWPVITAEQLQEARLRAGYTSQKALAEALDVSPRTVGTWEREGVSGRGEHAVRKLLWPSPAPLSHYSDYELLSEIGRRLGRISQRDEDPQDTTPSDFNARGIKGDNSPSEPGRRPAPAQGVASPPTSRSRRRRDNDARSSKDQDI